MMTKNQLRRLVEEELGLLLKDDQSSCRGNAKHDELGRWAGAETDGSHAIDDIPSDCETKRGQYERSGAKIGSSKKPCGRTNRKLCKKAP